MGCNSLNGKLGSPRIADLNTERISPNTSSLLMSEEISNTAIACKKSSGLSSWKWYVLIFPHEATRKAYNIPIPCFDCFGYLSTA